MKRITKTVFISSLFLIFLASCGERRISRNLLEIESYIDARPDSALISIRQIDTTSMRTKATKAKYALLHAMALDKNGIDTADVHIIMPAINYYSKYGTADNKLKGYLYLGIEQYNAKQFDQAIVSFYKAAGQELKVQDDNLHGLLYSRMAVTYMATRDYSQADVFLDNALKSFLSCNRKDQADKVLAQKATNYVLSRNNYKAQETFNHLLSDTTLDMSLKRSVEIDYAVFLLSIPTPNDTLSYNLISRALNNGGHLWHSNHYYAYAYLLNSIGKTEEAVSLLKKLGTSDYKDDYYYYYWKHAIEKKGGDYTSAYYSLWHAMQLRDSIINKAYDLSAANSERAFLEQREIENRLRLQNHKLVEGIILFVCLTMALAIISLFLLSLKKKKEREQEKERYNIMIDALNQQLLEKDNDNNRCKAKFALLADIYDEVYRFSKGGSDTSDHFYRVLQNKIGDLRSNNAAQAQFEKLLDAETDGIMTRFRKAFPLLTESELRMASYYFAGFDNTTVMLIMDISSLENTRMKKSRLKHKILAAPDTENKMFAELL